MAGGTDACIVFSALRPFARRLSKSVSWHGMQKRPNDVLAYLKFSILRLQLRHRKQSAQNAWSPVRMARSSIFLLQACMMALVELHDMRK